MGEIEYWSPKILGLTSEQFVERCARVAYRSEEKMTDTSYKEFVPRIVVKNRDHSVCEHVGDVTVAHKVTRDDMLELLEINPMIPFKKTTVGHKLLLNGRNIVEFLGKPSTATNNLLGSLKERYPVLLGNYEAGNFTYSGHIPAHEYIYDPKFILATYFIKGVSRVTETQWVRHRRMSYTVMSGRGVDVREQTFVIPPSVIAIDKESDSGELNARLAAGSAFRTYSHYRDYHQIPRQDARYFLPQGTATEMVVTATLHWWNYFFGLRSVKPSQWEIRYFSNLIQKDLHSRYPQYVSAPTEDVADGKLIS